jgi:hypothetical protein
VEFQGRKLRNEMKYYLYTHDYISLRTKVSTMLKMDKNSLSVDGYGIRSLYFDGVHDHSLYDKNNGIFKREKYRIRIYNGSDAKITVERKSKFGEFVCKEAASISREEYDSIIQGNYELLSAKEHPLLKEFYSTLAHRAFRPIVIVDYFREAYVYEPGNVRITFDKRLTAGVNSIDLFDPNLVQVETLLPAQTIMEVKFDDFLPDNIRKMVQPERHARSAISKYVICREIGMKHFKQ